VLVAIHGISRNAAEIAARFAAHPAFARTTIVAPLFDKDAFGQYQQIEARKAGQTRADTALIGLLDGLTASDGLPTASVSLFGFSGGAQMAHRFAMLHPRRVARLCVVSAGWYAMPDPAIPWPYGIGDGDGAARVGPEFLAIPTTVIVGNRDTRVDASVRQDALILEHQGRNRLRRARCFVRAAATYADRMGVARRPQLLTLHGVSHDFAQCVAEGALIEIAAQKLT
jgi:pimeloyl-ACP methyl ester carboxylesterase